MKTVAFVFGVIIAIILAIAVAFTIELGGLEWSMFFKPKYQNVERKTFEQSQSYVMGMTTTLAKRFDEYNKATSPSDREAIQNMVKMEFADFDIETVRSAALRNFLVNSRGY